MPSRMWFILFVFAATLTFFQPLQGETRRITNVGESGLGLDGYDPVSYHNKRPLKGEKKFSIELGEVRYLFANSKNRSLFLTDPQKYIPAFGGWCAWAMLEGKKVAVDPLKYKLIDGVTYQYYNGIFIDTLKKWNELAEKETEMELVRRATEKWKKLTSPGFAK